MKGSELIYTIQVTSAEHKYCSNCFRLLIVCLPYQQWLDYIDVLTVGLLILDVLCVYHFQRTFLDLTVVLLGRDGYYWLGKRFSFFRCQQNAGIAINGISPLLQTSLATFFFSWFFHPLVLLYNRASFCFFCIVCWLLLNRE